MNDIDVELNGSEVGIVKGIRILPFPQDHLRVEHQVDTKKQSSQAGVNQVGDRILPENQDDPEHQDEQTDDKKVWATSSEVRFGDA